MANANSKNILKQKTKLVKSQKTFNRTFIINNCFIMSISKNIISLIIPSFLIWLFPLLVSFLFYNQSGQLTINFWIFKLIMAMVGFSSAYFLLNKYYHKYSFNWINNSIIILVVNILLDLIVLIGLIKMNLFFYLVSVLPVYFIFIPITNYICFKRQKNPVKID